MKQVLLLALILATGFALAAPAEVESPVAPTDTAPATAQDEKRATAGEKAPPGGGADQTAQGREIVGGKVFVLPVVGPIDKSMLFIFRRAFKLVESENPQAIVIELETPGGGLRETEEIIAWMRSCKVPIYAFVNTHAQSAGAIISLACDKVFMTEGSRIGSAMPILINMSGGVEQVPEDVKEKIMSDTRALVRGLAQEHGHREDVAMAMVDSKVEVKVDGKVINSGSELLNLTAQEAIQLDPDNQNKPVLAAAIVKDVTALLDRVQITNPQLVRFEETASEKLARWITMIGPLLLSLGILALYIEFKTPGFGLPGIVGISLLALYFFGHFVAGLAGIEDIVLVAIGLALLAVEVFVLPGFGVIGLVGLGCVMAGIIMGLIPYVPHDAPALPNVAPVSALVYLQAAVVKLLLSFIIGGVGIAILARYLPKTSLYRNVVLNKALTAEQGFVSHTPELYSQLLGKTGTATTLLRPSGIAEIEQQRYDVVSTGDLIPKGTAIRVVEIAGSRIAVERVAEAKA